MNSKYTTHHYLISILKSYGINKIIASPGAQNARFNSILQEDDFFACYSVVDERSAAYVATGIAHETNAPVVITCTGATASRNYLSAMTEAFYRKIPIIAITFFNPVTNKYSLSPQYVDRSITQNDIKYESVELPMTDTEHDIKNCLLFLNAVISKAVYEKVPVHINCPAYNDFSNHDKSLPDNIWKTVYYEGAFDINKELDKKNVAIFIGEHRKFTEEETDLISNFALQNDIPVFCDHTSNYYGKNKILTSQAVCMLRLSDEKPDIIIDIGGISGNYSSMDLFKDTEIWRIPENKGVKARYCQKITKVFNNLDVFFKKINEYKVGCNPTYSKIKRRIDNITLPDLPLCNSLICQQLAQKIPHGSSMHLAILNALRCMNYFEIDSSIDINCNVGGFGIDGPVSTLVGQSLCSKNKTYFGLIGDLAFFYDMNALGIRHISNNLRLLIVNNNGGFEFRIGKDIDSNLGDKAGVLIASVGHNKGGAVGWAESCGFKYISAKTKEEFISKIDDFCSKECDKPIIFEVFTSVEDEQKGLQLMNTFNRNKLEEGIRNCCKLFVN